MEYLCDTERHLICRPYSIENLHIMAKELDIKKCWFHADPGHYDIPKRRINEIMHKCTILTTRELINIIRKSNGLDIIKKLWK